MGGSPSSSAGPTPQDSAQAQAMAQAAGQKFNIASSPIGAYAEALNQIQFNPIFQRVQSASNANSAMQNAAANMATMQQTNPSGFAGGQAFAKEAGGRLSDIMGGGMPVGLTPMNTMGAFDYPSQGSLPNLKQIQAQSQKLGNAVPNISFWGVPNNNNSWLNYHNG